jgi:hypothetical protein
LANTLSKKKLGRVASFGPSKLDKIYRSGGDSEEAWGRHGEEQQAGGRCQFIASMHAQQSDRNRCSAIPQLTATIFTLMLSSSGVAWHGMVLPSSPHRLMIIGCSPGLDDARLTRLIERAVIWG